jgi:hypothetical protein
MSDENSKYEEAALIRSHYNEAIKATRTIYHESEEVAAYLCLEIFRLENLKCSSQSEETERLERMSEKTEMLSRTKDTMRFILDKLHELARDRDKFVSDIYTSTKIVDLESKLSDLTPWFKELLTEVQSRADAAKVEAKITSEFSKARNYE